MLSFVKTIHISVIILAHMSLIQMVCDRNPSCGHNRFCTIFH